MEKNKIKIKNIKSFNKKINIIILLIVKLVKILNLLNQ